MIRYRAVYAVPGECLGWWRIISTSQWLDEDLDLLAQAMVSSSSTGDGQWSTDGSQHRPLQFEALR